MTIEAGGALAIPELHLEAFQLVQRIDGGLRNAEPEHRGTIAMRPLDERVRVQMREVLDGIHGIEGSSALADTTALEVPDQILREAT